MMIKKITFLLFMLPLSFFAQKQNVSSELLFVDYTHSIHVKGAPNATVVNAKLSASANSTLYEMDFIGEKSFIDEEYSEKGPVLRIRPKKNAFIFKDYNNRISYSIMRISMKPFLVKDSMSIFKWNIENEFKNVIGYKCQKANAEYRGRNYIAFFTTEIPFQTGPWKFSNLPGLILEAYSLDKVLEITANKLEIKNRNVIIENPYKKDLKGAIFWNDFIVEYKKKYNQLQRFRGPNGSTRSIPKESIEVYIE